MREVRTAVANEARECEPLTMATGLATFDAFAWASLLKGRQALVICRERARAAILAAALDEAGALVTIAPGQSIAVDRCRDGVFQHIVLSLVGPEPVSERLSPVLARSGLAVVVLAEPERHADLRKDFSIARIGDLTMSDRDLVLFILASPDE